MEDFLKQLDRWYRGGLASDLLEVECSEVANLLSNIHGDYLLQIAGPASMEHCAASVIPYRLHLSSELISGGSCVFVQGDLSELPIMPNAMDVILVPHALEFVKDPFMLLKEAYDALAPGGQLIILGFNPRSLWGFRRWFHRRKGVPWCGRFLSQARVKYWLRKLGLSVVVSKTFCFQWSVKSSRKGMLSDFPEVLGQLCWPGCGGVYLITAQKKIHAPLLKKTDWWGKPLPGRSGIVEPITRV